MRSQRLVLKTFADIIVFFTLCTVITCVCVGVVPAQKKPTPLKSGADTDDKVLCAHPSYTGSQYCGYYDKYSAVNATPEEKLQARNDMTDLLIDQIDTYYKSRKDSRKVTNAWLQTIFDILEIGAGTAISIVNGTRPKTVIADALTGFKTGRTAVNKNFDLLQTQILINKMNSNRDGIHTDIIKKRGQDATQYSWYMAKSDLRQYLYAGTFSDALDRLVEQTGNEAAEAKVVLNGVALSPPSTKAETDLANLAQKTLGGFQDLLKKPGAENDAAVKKLQKITAEFEKDKDISVLLNVTEVTSHETDGNKLLKAVISIRRAARLADPPKIVLLNKINQIIANNN